MKLEELKKYIESGVAPHDFIIFIRDAEGFLAKQYVQALCDANNLVKKKINSLAEESSAIGLVMDYTDSLRILDVETFDEYLEDYSSLSDTVVICDKIDKKIRPLIEEYVIELPVLKDWQIKDYMKVLMPTVDTADIDWLYAATHGSVNRIVNEIDKIKLFDEKDWHTAINELRFEQNTDLVNIDSFKIVDAILGGDKATLLDFMLHKQSADVDFMAVVGGLLQKAKKILLAVYQRQGLTAADIGFASDRQMAYYVREYSRYPQRYLQYLIGFLSEIDIKLKSGLLDMPNDLKLDYLISHVIA